MAYNQTVQAPDLLPPCLTLKRPWAYAVVDGLKPVENRSWPPPERILGKRLLIHAGKGVDGWAYDDHPELERYRDDPGGLIIGGVTLARWTDVKPRSRFAAEDSVYWMFTKPVRFATPIPAAGKQRFWPGA